MHKEGIDMATSQLGVIGIVVEDLGVTGQINAILHEYADIIVGRLGIPYRSRGVSVIALTVDGEAQVVSEMTAKLATLPKVTVKSTC